MFYRIKQPGINYKLWSILFGIAQIVDGIVRFVTLGNFATRFPIDCSRIQAKIALNNAKAKRDK